MRREIKRAVKPLEGQLGQVAHAQGVVVEVLLKSSLQRELGKQACQPMLLVDATSVVKAVLQGLQPAYPAARRRGRGGTGGLPSRGGAWACTQRTTLDGGKETNSSPATTHAQHTHPCLRSRAGHHSQYLRRCIHTARWYVPLVGSCRGSHHCPVKQLSWVGCIAFGAAVCTRAL